LYCNYRYGDKGATYRRQDFNRFGGDHKFSDSHHRYVILTLLTGKTRLVQ
jgi:hypothetical protein